MFTGTFISLAGTSAWVRRQLNPGQSEVGIYRNDRIVCCSASLERAGLRVGDVVLKLDGAPTPSVDAVHKLLTRDKVGRKVALDVLRDGVLMKLSLDVRERPDERRSA